MSIIVSYFPIFSKKTLSIENNPPAIIGVLQRERYPLFIYIDTYRVLTTRSNMLFVSVSVLQSRMTSAYFEMVMKHAILLFPKFCSQIVGQKHSKRFKLKNIQNGLAYIPFTGHSNFCQEKKCWCYTLTDKYLHNFKLHRRILAWMDGQNFVPIYCSRVNFIHTNFHPGKKIVLCHVNGALIRLYFGRFFFVTNTGSLFGTTSLMATKIQASSLNGGSYKL